MKGKLWIAALAAVMTTGWAVTSAADSTEARCDVYPAGEDHTDKMIACRFYQAQGHVVITREDGVEHDLMPRGDAPGNFTDQHGNAVYRQSGLGDQGLIFRFPDESVYVYWNTAALNPDPERQPWVPAVDLDFDATAWIRCRDAGAAEFGQCPAGALRMDGGEASIVVENPPGETFTINFMKDYVNATNREAEATLEGDTWTVIIDGEQVYEIPLAMIEGG